MRKGMIAALLALLLCFLLCGCGENAPEPSGTASSGESSSGSVSSDTGESKTPPTDFVRVPQAVTILYIDWEEWDITYSYDPASKVLHREEGAITMDAILTTDFNLDEAGTGLAMYHGYEGDAGFTYKDGKLFSCAWTVPTENPEEGQILRNGKGDIGGMEWLRNGETRHIGCTVEDGLVLSLDLEFAGERIFYDYFMNDRRVDGYNVRMEKYGDLIWSATVSLQYADGLLTEKTVTVTHESEPGEPLVTTLPDEGQTVYRFTYGETSMPDDFAAAVDAFAFLSPEWRFLHSPLGGAWIL